MERDGYFVVAAHAGRWAAEATFRHTTTLVGGGNLRMSKTARGGFPCLFPALFFPMT